MWLYVNAGRWFYLVSLSRDVVSSLDGSLHAIIEISPASVVGLVDREGEAGIVLELEVDLAVLSGFVNRG